MAAEQSEKSRKKEQQSRTNAVWRIKLTHTIRNPYEDHTIQLRIKKITNKLNIKPPIKINSKASSTTSTTSPKISLKIEAEFGETIIQQKVAQQPKTNLQDTHNRKEAKS